MSNTRIEAEKALYNAAMVIFLDERHYDWLKENDPMALKQLKEAIRDAIHWFPEACVLQNNWEFGWPISVIEKLMDEDKYIEGVVRVSLDEIKTDDEHGGPEYPFEDLLAKKLCGNEAALTHLTYDIVGNTDNTLLIRVKAHAGELMVIGN